MEERIIAFSEPLPELILKGEKDTTWRIDEPVPVKRTSDTDGIKEGDLLSLRNKKGDEFAKAKTVRIRRTNFANLSNEDLEGHEKFKSRDELYKQFSEYYKINVNNNTKIVVIKFELIR